MQKVLLVIFTIALMSVQAMAGPKLKNVKGLVVDKAHNGLAGAKVEVKGTNIVVYADFDGSFTIEKLKPGTYDLVISMISYQDLDAEEVTLSMENSNHLLFQLTTR